ncbi:MAG: sigma-70 family RNA polymerase sigma factor, partial [Anaerolineae bacterium]|nr:sigma-70 family RNA polymerase sigma factor [Anaerolineae bacterium]
MDSLLEAGIDVIPAPANVDEVVPVDDAAKDDKPDDDPLAALPEVDDKDERDALLRVLKKDLTSDAGYQAALDTDDVVGLYLKEAGRVPLLTAQEEVMLAKRMEAAVFARARLEEPEIEQIEVMSWSEEQRLRETIMDGDSAQEHLIRANARLVISVAKKYIGRGVPFLDLIQEGNIGLIRATNKFEYQRGHKFSTYATWWIRQAVSRAVADQGRTIRVPVHMGDQ